jgi:hypothetical protein
MNGGRCAALKAGHDADGVDQTSTYPLSRMGAKIGQLRDAIRVMPGLVPGIHVVKPRVDLRTSTFFSASAGAIILDLRCTSRRGCPGQARA